MRDDIKRALNETRQAILDRIAEATTAVDEVIAAVEKVQPVQVELTQELADRIVELVHGPLTIPQPFSDWIREQAKFSEIQRADPVGYGAHACTSQYVLRSNGTMYWEFRDMNGATLWRGTFVPPDFGKGDGGQGQ